MKFHFKTITTFLLIVLIGMLIGILIRYYNKPIKVSTTTPVITNTNQNNPIQIQSNNSGEFVSNTESVSEDKDKMETIINESGEINLKNQETIAQTMQPGSSVDQSQNDISQITTKNNQVIITSEDTMTNKEKREILTELDNTLMELLDVVDKVQTVDESRLITEEGEVQH